MYQQGLVTVMLGDDRRKREGMTQEFRLFSTCSQKEIQAATSLKPTAEGAQDFYITESAIKVSKMSRLPCHFDPRCSKTEFGASRQIPPTIS